jgi:hypothetical protein
MPVDVDDGVPAVRGDAVVEGSNWGRPLVKEREREVDGDGRRAREERKQRAQIMVVLELELRTATGVGVLSLGETFWCCTGGEMELGRSQYQNRARSSTLGFR